MIRITCDICERDITSIASLADGKKCAYCITVYGKQLDMCKEYGRTKRMVKNVNRSVRAINRKEVI